MFGRKNQRTNGGPIDRVADAVVRAGGLGDGEAERVAASPFLYSKIRARISDEQARRAGPQAGWVATWLVARRAIPALVVVALVAFAAFLFSATRNPGGRAGAGAGGDGVSVVVAGGTCALSNSAECAVSNEDVLALLFAEGETKR